MSSPPETITASLTELRRAQLSDAGPIFDIASDAEVMHFMDWPIPKDIGAVRAHLEDMRTAWNSGREYQWVVLERATGACAGTCSLRIKGHAADVGFFFGRTFWGRGLAFDAANAVLNWLATQPHILRIWATADAENLRSRRLLERLGLRLEGIMRCATIRPCIGGPPRDTVLYARTKDTR